jgi:uncharacterized membrane protein
MFFFIGTLAVAFATLTYYIDLSKLSSWQEQAISVFAVIGAVSALSLYWCMWVYWTRIDTSRRSTKRVWFAILLVGLFWGSALYYFAVYLPQVLRKRRAEA